MQSTQRARACLINNIYCAQKSSDNQTTLLFKNSWHGDADTDDAITGCQLLVKHHHMYRVWTMVVVHGSKNIYIQYQLHYMYAK